MWTNPAQVRNFDDLQLISELTGYTGVRDSPINFSEDDSRILVHVVDETKENSKVLVWDYLNDVVDLENAPLDTLFLDSLQLLSDPHILMVINKYNLYNTPVISFWDYPNNEKLNVYNVTDDLEEIELYIASSAFSIDKRLLVLGLASEPAEGSGEIEGFVPIKKIVFYGSR
jgi:hypothetical protein